MIFAPSIPPSTRLGASSKAPSTLPPGLGPSWTAAKQEAYRASTQPQALLHLLLDASGSMEPHRQLLVDAVARYESWLKFTLSPVSMAQRWLFAGTVYALPQTPIGMHALHALPALTLATYDPQALFRSIGAPVRYSGTNLFDAIGRCCAQSHEPGQHILVVFTDGRDTGSETWSAHQVKEHLTTLTQHAGWLCCYLGAHTDALLVGELLGFARGNCLEFSSDKLPEAFTQLQQSTERFLTAPEPERKLLARTGVLR